MGQVGCYTLDLYCDLRTPACEQSKWKYDPTPYTGRTYSECAREAKREGWLIDPKGQGSESGRAECPSCRRYVRDQKKAARSES